MTDKKGNHGTRLLGNAFWAEVATVAISEATLVEQPTGKELEYRIVVVNKAGDGKPSNMGVL